MMTECKCQCIPLLEDKRKANVMIVASGCSENRLHGKSNNLVEKTSVPHNNRVAKGESGVPMKMA